MTLTVDSNQKKLYTLLQRLLVKLLLSPDSPEQYGTEIGSQLSFSFPQAVSLFSGSGVKPLLSQKTHRRNSMPTADCLRKRKEQFRNKLSLTSISLLHFSNFPLIKDTLFIPISQIGKKGAEQKKKGLWGLASLTIKRKMRKFFGGAGNPTRLQKHLTQRSLYHA